MTKKQSISVEIIKMKKREKKKVVCNQTTLYK